MDLKNWLHGEKKKELEDNTMKMNIPITKTIFGDEEAIVKPLETGWVVQGPNVAKYVCRFYWK